MPSWCYLGLAYFPISEIFLESCVCVNAHERHMCFFVQLVRGSLRQTRGDCKFVEGCNGGANV